MSVMSGPTEEAVSKEFQPRKFKDEFLKRLDEERDERNQYWQRNSNIHMKPRDGHSDIVTSSRHNPFIFAPPISQSTPKTAHQSLVRPPIQKELKLTWGRLPPPMSRPASAMPATSNDHYAHHNNVTDRYPSYMTLPRPDQLDVEQLQATIATRQLSHTPSLARAPAIPISTQPPFPYFEPSPHLHLPSPQPTNLICDWSGINLRCHFATVTSLTIFGIGAMRMWQGAKWALGVEMFYAVLCLLSAFTGLYASRSLSHTAAVLCFLTSAVNVQLALIPLLLGLFPTIPMIFPELDPSLLVSSTEPVLLDIALSAACLLQMFVNTSIVWLGCRCFASLCTIVDELRLNSEMQSVFYENKIPPQSASPIYSNKPSQR